MTYDLDQLSLLLYVGRCIDKLPEDDVREEFRQVDGHLRTLYNLGFKPIGANLMVRYEQDAATSFEAALLLAIDRRMSIDFEETPEWVTIKFWEDGIDWAEAYIPEFSSRAEATLYALSLAAEQWLDYQLFRLLNAATAQEAERRWLESEE